MKVEQFRKVDQGGPTRFLEIKNEMNVIATNCNNVPPKILLQ